MAFNNEEKITINYAKKVLSNYWKCTYKAIQKYPTLSGIEYTGMPSNPTPRNTEESKVIHGIDNQYTEYLNAINQRLNLIRHESEEYYLLLHKKYIRKKNPAQIQVEMVRSQPWVYRHTNYALLKFGMSCSKEILPENI